MLHPSYDAGARPRSGALLALASTLALTTLGVAACVPSPSDPASPVPPNAGLEVDADADGVPDGWSRQGYGTNTARWSQADAHSGASAAKVEITSYQDGDRKLLPAYTSGGLPVAVGTSYDLSAWYRTDGVAHVVVFRRTADGTWSYWTGSGELARSSTWRSATYRTPPVPSGTVAISYGLNLRSVGSLVTDDYGISAVGATAPTTAPQTTTAPTTTAPTSPPAALLVDRFDRPDGLVTNEYAFWNPGAPGALTDATWELGSGSLFAKGGAGHTGEPDTRPPDATSSTGTNSAVFRLTTRRADFTDVEVSFRLRHEGFVSTSSTPAVAWDGVHVFLRYADEENLYYASVDRRDGTTQIKKKVSGGPSNGGTYYTLGSGTNPVPAGSWQDVRASVRDLADGSVEIRLLAGGKLVASAVDRGTGGPPIRAGSVGIRGDNSRFSFDDFVVTAV